MIRLFIFLLTASLFCGWNSLAFGGEIHDAAKAGNLEKVKALLKDNPELVSSKDESGLTPLEWAVIKGNKEMVKLLLNSKADVNAKGSTADTVLHAAAVFNHKDVAELLLANKADVNAKNNKGETPLHLAAFNCAGDIIKVN